METRRNETKREMKQQYLPCPDVYLAGKAPSELEFPLCLPRRRQLVLQLQAALNTNLALMSPKIKLLLSQFESEPSSDEEDEELKEHCISYHSLY